VFIMAILYLCTFGRMGTSIFENNKLNNRKPYASSLSLSCVYD
jgi:hypothetical protein